MLQRPTPLKIACPRASAPASGVSPAALWSNGVWSADGARVAYAWRARAAEGPIDSRGVPPTRLVVCAADGTHASTVLTADEEFLVLAWW